MLVRAISVRICSISYQFRAVSVHGLLSNYSRALFSRLTVPEYTLLKSDFGNINSMSRKKPIDKPVKVVLKSPKNVILMWIGDTPKIVRKRIAPKDNSQLRSLYIHFLYRVPRFNTSVEVNLVRPLDELFLQTCNKIKGRVEKFILKESKEKVNEKNSYEIVFSAPNHPDLLMSANEVVYKDENLHEIHINNDVYRIVRNPPRCTKLALKLKPLVGCPMIASSSIVGGDQNVHPSFHWFVGEADAPLVTPMVVGTSNGLLKYSLDGWAFRSTGHSFIPETADIGKRVCVLLDVGEDAIIHCTVSDDVVSGNDEPYIFEDRQATHCGQEADDGCIRLMSYNVLADLYLDLKLKQEELYFPYCLKDYQEYAYRYPLLLREIPGYKADIIFLQEVDERLWLRFLPNVMNSCGYDCHYRKKGLKVNEGLVICHRKKKFRYLDGHDVWLPDLLDNELYPENADVIKLLDNNEELKTMFMSKSAVIQLMVLKSNMPANTDSTILLANTHLFFDPRYEIIKILQTLLCTRWIVRNAAEYARQNTEEQIHVLFAGDFNSTPDGAVCQLLSTGNIPAKAEYINYRQDLFESFSIQSSSSSFTLTLTNLTGETESTNYTRHIRYDGQIGGFEGCLDYIWGSANVEVKKVVPMPSKKHIKNYVALPSKISPSDHLPLVCDVKLRK